MDDTLHWRGMVVLQNGIGVKQNSIGFLEFTARMPSMYVYTIIKSSKIFV